MIEEQALVCKVQGRRVWVRTAKTSACKQCAEQQNCSSAVLASDKSGRELQVESDIPLSEGDIVVLGVEAKGLLKSAALLYLAPIVALILGGIAGERVALRVSAVDSDIIIVLSALIFFLCSLFLLNKLHCRRLSEQLTNPVIIRKL